MEIKFHKKSTNHFKNWEQSLEEHQETVQKQPKFTQSWHQIPAWRFNRHDMKMWSVMDWFRAFYVHLCSCVQEHACARPHAWRCAVTHPSQCSSCWWRNKIPLPLHQTVFSRLHSMWHLALSHNKDRDRRLCFSVCRRNLTQCTTSPHSCTKIWFPEVLPAMAGWMEQVCICIDSTLIVTGLGFICTYFTKIGGARWHSG